MGLDRSGRCRWREAVLSLSEDERRERDQELQDAEEEEERKAKGIGRLLGRRKPPDSGESGHS